MKDIDSFFETAILRGYAVPGSLRVIAEWNYNSLFDVSPVNDPDDTGWVLNKDLFPAKSVADQLRPSTGVFYGITDEALTDASTLGLDANRYYTIDELNNYKYWICPTPSSPTPNDSDLGFNIITDYAVSRGTLLLDYGNFLNMNKLSVTFNLGPTPADWSIWVFEQTVNDWVEINNPTIDPITGKAQVWWDGSAWVGTQQLSETVYRKISKVKMEVRSLTEPNKRLQVIEVSGRREIDMTPRVQEYNISTSMDDESYLYPVGRMSANDGRITFNNDDLALNGEDPTSDFYGALVGWCQYRTYVSFDLSEWGGSSNYLMRTGTMYANDFQQVNEYEYQVELFDIFKILQTINCPALLIEGQSIARIVATILDMVGVDAYRFEFSDFDVTNNVKYFWTDGTQKVFEALDSLMKSHQAALFVDDNGFIRLLTRNDILPVAGEEPDWILKGEKEGLDLADIITLKKKYAIQINKVNIKYTKREAKTDAADIREQPLTSQIWQAEDTVVLRAAPLVRNMYIDDGSGIGNFSFEGYDAINGMHDWAAYNCTLTQSMDHAYEAYYSGKIVPNGIAAQVSIESTKVNVPSDKSLSTTARVWLNTVAPNNFSMTVRWWDANNNLISRSDEWVSVPAGSWQEVVTTFTAPNDDAKYATVMPTLRGTPTQTWYIDRVILYPTGYFDAADIWVSPEKAATWPFKGKVNIDGELIEFDGKSYGWWQWTNGTPIYRENIVHNEDERKQWDRFSYNSYTLGGIQGGVSTNPIYQNRYIGRIHVSKRDADGSGQRKVHRTNQKYGWYTMDMWCQKSNSWGFPGKYWTPGGNQYNYNNLRDWDKKINWTECQSRVTVANSILTVDNLSHNSAPDHPSHATIATIDMGDTEYREFGTRLKIRSNTKGQAVIVLYPTNLSGYDNNNPSTTEIFNANRCYLINIFSTEYVESKNRTINEITVQYKNGDSLSRVWSGGQVGGNGGQIKIDYDKWYDIDIVYRDGAGENLEGGGFYGARSAIEIYVDGAFMDTFYPGENDSIRPTSLIGIGARDTTIVDFEYLYGSTTSTTGRAIYKDNELFDAYNLTLSAGTNMYESITLPIGNDWEGDGVISLSTFGADASLIDFEVISYDRSQSKKLIGSTPITLKKEQRLSYQLADIMQIPGQLRIRYSATNPISICFEYSKVRNYPYGIDTEPIPPPSSYYDLLKGGFVSTKVDEMFFTPQRFFNTQYLSHNITTPTYLSYFFEDFGSIVHEVRDFEVDFDPAPAKGVSVYSSNPHSKVINQRYSPVKGYFTLVNTSHRDEIINGTEELDESNSIDYSLLMYGYVLEEKGSDTEEVKNELSIRRHGTISEDLDADWIFTKDEAKALGAWIVDHWGDSMDTLELQTFLTLFLEVGDHVKVHYPNANINPDWYYIVAGKELSYDNEGLSFNVIVRRVTP